MSNNQNPWGGKESNTNIPPDLDEVIRELKNKFNNLFHSNKPENAQVVNGDKKPNTTPFKYVIILAIIVWIASGFYIIDPAEKGVVMRFGAFVEIKNAGPHWHLPYPIENIHVVNVSEVRKTEIGFRALINNRGEKFTRRVPAESIMLTSDGNIVDTSFEVQYTINDAQHYLFNVANPEKTLEQVANSAIREVIGKHKIDYIITEGRGQIAQEVEKKSQTLLDYYKVGLHINTINFKSAQAPDQVQAAYSDVTKAKTDKNRYINQAQSYANDILPKARGKSARLLEEANAYKSQVISKSEGEANRFLQILSEYEKAKIVTKERLYRETMEEVLANTSKVIINNKSNSLMYLPIDKLIDTNKKTTQNSNSTTEENKAESPTSIRNVFRNRGGKQ